MNEQQIKDRAKVLFDDNTLEDSTQICVVGDPEGFLAAIESALLSMLPANGHVLTHDGVVRKVLGTLPVLKTGEVCGIEADIWYTSPSSRRTFRLRTAPVLTGYLDGDTRVWPIRVFPEAEHSSREAALDDHLSRTTPAHSDSEPVPMNRALYLARLECHLARERIEWSTRGPTPGLSTEADSTMLRVLDEHIYAKWTHDAEVPGWRDELRTLISSAQAAQRGKDEGE